LSAVADVPGQAARKFELFPPGYVQFFRSLFLTWWRRCYGDVNGKPTVTPYSTFVQFDKRCAIRTHIVISAQSLVAPCVQS